MNSWSCFRWKHKIWQMDRQSAILFSLYRNREGLMHYTGLQYLLLGSIKYESTNFHYKYIPTLPDMYLAKSLLTVTTHPSLTRARNTNGTWVSYTPSISGEDKSALISLKKTKIFCIFWKEKNWLFIKYVFNKVLLNND